MLVASAMLTLASPPLRAELSNPLDQKQAGRYARTLPARCARLRAMDWWGATPGRWKSGAASTSDFAVALRLKAGTAPAPEGATKLEIAIATNSLSSERTRISTVAALDASGRWQVSTIILRTGVEITDPPAMATFTILVAAQGAALDRWLADPCLNHEPEELRYVPDASVVSLVISRDGRHRRFNRTGGNGLISDEIIDLLAAPNV